MVKWLNIGKNIGKPIYRPISTFFYLNKCVMVSIKILRSTLFSILIIIRKVSCAPNQHIRMISEESPDNKDWINDAENSALHYGNTIIFKKYIKIQICFKNIIKYTEQQHTFIDVISKTAKFVICV